MLAFRSHSKVKVMSTIAEILTLGGCQFKAYDLGRRVEKISRSSYLAFEQGAEPYSNPIQGHACFALVFAKPDQAQSPYIWLLKFPLDEQSKLQYAARDDFLRRVIEALGNDVTNSEIDSETLNNHPYAFQPSQEKLAVLNARIRKELHQPASLYYESAYEYYGHQPTEQGWQALGLQGIADLAVRLDEKEVSSGLAQQIAKLPEPAFNALAQCLEHVSLTPEVTEALAAFPSEQQTPFWLRALTGASDQRLYQLLADKLNQVLSLDELISIAARHWRVLNTPERVLMFLEALVRSNSELAVFAALVADLNALPACRSACMAALRSPERTPALTAAIGQLFNQYQPPHQ